MSPQQAEAIGRYRELKRALYDHLEERTAALHDQCRETVTIRRVFTAFVEHAERLHAELREPEQAA